MLMTMDCPRCGFNQPLDQFCAQCGLDVAAARARRPPLWRRVLASPKLYVGLGLILILALAWVLYGALGSGARTAERGEVIASRDAADGVAEPRPVIAARIANDPPAAPAPATARPEPLPRAAPNARPIPKLPMGFDVEFWEISHDQLRAALTPPEGSDPSGGERVTRVPESAHFAEALRAHARALGTMRHGELRARSKVEIRALPEDPVHFDFLLEFVGMSENTAHFRGRAGLVKTSTDGAGPPDLMLDATLELGPTDTLVIVLEPDQRRSGPEAVGRSGPISILGSPNFQVGETDWIATLRLR